MTEIPVASLLLAAAGGVLIGLLYFGVLWWTVRRLASARRPALLVAGSFLIRAAAAAAGLVFVAGGKPLALVAAVAGFLLGRTILIRVMTRPLRGEGAAAAIAPRSDAKTAAGINVGRR